MNGSPETVRVRSKYLALMKTKISYLIFLSAFVLLQSGIDGAELGKVEVKLRLEGVVWNNVALRYLAERVHARLVIPQDDQRSAKVIFPSHSEALNVVDGVSRTRASVYDKVEAGRYLLEVVDSPVVLSIITHYFNKMIMVKSGKSITVTIDLPLVEVDIPYSLGDKLSSNIQDIPGVAFLELTSSVKNADGSPILEFARPCQINPARGGVLHTMRCWMLPDGQYDFSLAFHGRSPDSPKPKGYPVKTVIHVKDGKLREEMVKFGAP